MAEARRSPIRLGIVATHPVQYHAPWFRALAGVHGLDLKVYFGFEPDPERQGHGFGTAFSWDQPLRDGYESTVLRSWRSRPHFRTFLGNVVRDVRRTFERDMREVVLVTGWESAVQLQAMWAAHQLGLPLLVRGESSALRERGSLTRIGHRVLLRQFDGMLAIGRSNRDFYARNECASERIFQAPYFVDNDFFRERAELPEARRAEIRQRWSVPEGRTCVLFAGKLQPKKCARHILEAVALVRKDLLENMHLLVVGDGPLRSELEGLVGAHGLPVTFAGFLNQGEIPSAYAIADVLVLPSDFGETWGLVVNEAMACGVPAIVSDRVGCGPDLVLEGQTGEIFPWGDRARLAELLADVVRDRASWKAMGRRAQKLVLREYSVQRSVDGTLAAVRAVTGVA